MTKNDSPEAGEDPYWSEELLAVLVVALGDEGVGHPTPSGRRCARGSGKQGLGAGGEPSGAQRTCARSYLQLDITKPKAGRHGARGAGWQNKCPGLTAKTYQCCAKRGSERKQKN